MNQTFDFWIIFIVKLLVLFGFIEGIKFWIKRNKGINNILNIVYWILGIFFVLALSSHIFEAALLSISLNLDSSLLDKESVKPLAFLFGMIFFILIGVKYLKK